jgi:thioredoxin-like negative regulator of GroEL
MTAIATDAAGTRAAEAAGDAGAAAARDPKVLAEEVRTYTDLLKGRYKHHLKHADVSRALAAGDVLSAAAEHSGQLAPLLAAVEAAPKDAGARFALAEAQLALGQHAAAVDNCLLIVRAEPGWRDGAAKSLLLKVFETLGPSHPVSVDGRKRLSKLLFR